ncbi:MAG: BA14K family protein [Bauldia sp.]|uniref:BA14K family protein n=1 Tax=Bauldia sp. TaxID=2575872 RepID=UPI001DBD7D85|nr:BA14K family protein [Bauldia sp.]MCB1494780.1 BA14K family protein [Bauldia sp.]
MKKFALAAMAALLGLASITAAPTAASAAWKGKNNNYQHQKYNNHNTWTPGVGFAAGALVGLGVGALVTAPRTAPRYYAPPPRPRYYAPPAPAYYRPPPPPVYYPRRAWRQAHVDWCLANYRSYNPATDTFMGYDGYAHRCISPY